MSSEQDTGSSLSSCLPYPSTQVVPTDSALTSPGIFLCIPKPFPLLSQALVLDFPQL